MRYGFERITQPAIEAVSMAEMKRHLRAYASDHSEDDDFTAFIQGGRQWVEWYTGRALVDQQWRLTIGGRNMAYIGGDSVGGYDPNYVAFSARDWMYWRTRGEIYLRKSPVLEILSVSYIDIAGNVTVVDPTTYLLKEPDAKYPRLVAVNGSAWQTWQYGQDLQIEFRAGYVDLESSPPEDASVVPVCFKQAIKLWAEANYDRDEKLMKIYLDAAERLVQSEKSEMSLA